MERDQRGTDKNTAIMAGKMSTTYARPALSRGEFRICERPVVTHLERPVAVARECETRLRMFWGRNGRLFAETE